MSIVNYLFVLSAMHLLGSCHTTSRFFFKMKVDKSKPITKLCKVNIFSHENYPKQRAAGLGSFELLFTNLMDKLKMR